MITATPGSSPLASHVGSASARRVRSIVLPGPAGSLEAVINEGSPGAPFAAVIAHPHPSGGGSMHNKVVYHAMKVINEPRWGFGCPVLRFNFRGTGRSEGEHHGAAESADVLAALRWIENEYKMPVVAAGFSFGAAMTLAACCATSLEGKSPIPGLEADRAEARNSGAATSTIDVRALVAIGLPVRSGARPDAQRYAYACLESCAIPKLFLSGDQDQFATKSELMQLASAAAEPMHLALVPGADHFFTGHLERMQLELARWLKEQVYDPGQRYRI